MTIHESELRAQFHLGGLPTGTPFVRVFREDDPLRPVLYRPGATPIALHNVFQLGGHHRERLRDAGAADVFLDLGFDQYRAQAEDALRDGVPSWIAVPDNDPSSPPGLASREIVREVEGRLQECRQTYTDIPMLPWHFWYDWTFNVQPEGAYRYLLNVNTHAWRPDTPHRHLHCEWDTGVTWRGGPGRPWNHAGVMYSDEVPTDVPVGVRWAWPMGEWHVWLAGRWIYDVGHSPWDAHHPDAPGTGLADSELHPVMAMATTRTEAVLFNDGHRRPAVQFVFFACINGGYRPFPRGADAWGGRDYHYLVDLPPRPASASAHPVVSSEEGGDPGQTVAARPLQPELMVRIEAGHTVIAAGRVGPTGGPWEYTTPAEGMGTPTVPTVHPVRRDATIAPPGTDLTDRVLIHFPRSLFDDLDSYGVQVSLAWHDPAQEHELYVVTVTMDWIAPYARKVVGAGTEWFSPSKSFWLRFAINGRWFQRRVESSALPGNRRVSIGQAVVLHLSARDAVQIQVDGMVTTRSVEQRVLGMAAASGPDSVHGVMELANDQRTVSAGRPPRAITWTDVENAGSQVSGSLAVEDITTGMRTLMESTLKNENLQLPTFRENHPVSAMIAAGTSASIPLARSAPEERFDMGWIIGAGQQRIHLRTGFECHYTIAFTPFVP